MEISFVYLDKFFLSIACCPTLNVSFENGVKENWGIGSKYLNFEGVYIFQGFSDGMDYWVNVESEIAIWYKELSYSGTNYYWWIFGTLSSLGSITAGVASFRTLEKTCPNNEGYYWYWLYDNNNGAFVDGTNDVYIKCANEDDFCTSENPCSADQGDCDIHDECLDGLDCGSNNCPDHLGFHSEFDCCYASTVGDEDFCTTDDPCALDEGDCDSSNECQANLSCDPAISCPSYLGFASDVNCCSSGSGCMSH